MQVILDTNIYLSFYRLSKEDIEALHQIENLSEQGLLSLYSTTQIEDEYYRARDTLVSRAIDDLKRQRSNLSVPAFFRDHNKFDQIASASRKLREMQDDLIKSVELDFQEKTLPADELIRGIIARSTILKPKEATFRKAFRRFWTGNPPRKPDDRNIGDALNWEMILEAAASFDNLNIVSNDGDFFSPIDGMVLNSFLEREWSAHKPSGHGMINVFQSISGFLKKYFPDVKVSENIPANYFVDRLERSSSFAETHRIIGGIKSAGGLTIDDVKGLIKVAEENDQVYGIFHDDDLFRLLCRCLY